MYFQEKRGLAICGLACALCSAEDCPGCKERGGECPLGDADVAEIERLRLSAR